MNPIFINSSPNTQGDDVSVAFKQLLSLKNKDNSKIVENFEKDIENLFQNEINAVAFDSARSSFFHILKTWGITQGDEILVPAFTCTVIVNPILWLGAKPIYVDIEKDSLNIDLKDLKSKITPKSKVILAQHTFGKTLDMDEVMNIAKSNNLKVVEDCAHSLGVKYKDKLTGSIGDAAVITFGISKVISGVRGGMALVQNTEDKEKLISMREKLPNFPKWFNFRNILNPIIWSIITPIYYLGIGKLTIGRFLILILQKTKFISVDNIVEKCEEIGMKPLWIPARMSGNLASMANHQLKKLDLLNNHRRKIAKIYSDELQIPMDPESNYLRFPVYVKDKPKVMEFFRKKRVILGNWYKSILHIPEKNYSSLLYSQGDCPNAEYAAKYIVNLPTFIKVSEEDARFIAQEIKQFLKI